LIFVIFLKIDNSLTPFNSLTSFNKKVYLCETLKMERENVDQGKIILVKYRKYDE